ncbi:MAG: mechanosensitive ion channel family protein [Ruminococcaceae bacterium]|nr:mechanosensitive ion channel family protein [Oscillospiraceae bacterium]
MNWDAIFAFFQQPLLVTVFKVVIIAVIGTLLIRVINRTLKKILEKSKLEKAAHSLIRTLVKTVLYILLGLILASSLGIDVTGIVALASVATLAISLALQNMLANVIGGFTLLYTHPFSAGDYVEIAGQSGSVKDVGIAYTRLTTVDNKLVSIPNSAVVSAEIVNYSVTGTRRVDWNITASYDSDPDKVVAALLEAVEDDRVLADPAPFATLSGYGDSAISYTLRVWVKTEDYWDVYHKANRKIIDIFRRDGIEMTYPHLNVHLDK